MMNYDLNIGDWVICVEPREEYGLYANDIYSIRDIEHDDGLHTFIKLIGLEYGEYDEWIASVRFKKVKNKTMIPKRVIKRFKFA